MKGGFAIDNYIPYHVHSDYSLLDSATNYKDYINLAVENGHKAIAFTEHGKPLGWVNKKLACDEAGIKYIHGVEIYLTKSLEPKVRDNYHTVLLAKNYDGVLELNRLVTLSCNREHFYYTNRLSFDEFLGISDNIISTSACLASPLNKLEQDDPYYMKLADKYTFYEIQAHDNHDQVVFNKRLYELSKRTGKPLIAGTDTHNSSKYKAECRAILCAAKRKSYGDEDTLDLTYKTFDELVEMFKKQGALPEEVFMKAIDNTNLLDDMVEEFELDRRAKYPILYGSREADSERFVATIEAKFKEKIDSGIVPEDKIDDWRREIDEEVRVFKKLNMDGFMLSMSELVCWCKEHGMAIGPARGSVGGSTVAYVTDITDLDAMKWHTVFSRFCNEDREEVGDVDIDVIESDRPAIFKYIVGRFGERKTARVGSYGTLADKSVIDEVCRAMMYKWNEEHGYKFDVKVKENPYNYDKAAKIKEEFAASKTQAMVKYPEVMYYFDGLVGTKVSQSVHPAGMVISPITLDDNFGVFEKDDDLCLMIDMDEAHEVGCVKYDFLILKTVGVINDTCKYIGIPYPKTNEIDWDDEAVWEDMRRDLTTIFQFESAYGAECFKKFKTDSIFDMSLVTACIRPSGASYRDELLARKSHKNPSPIIDELLKDNLGWLVYQEDTIKFLQQICGLSGSEADNVRRAIGRKQVDRLEAAMPSILEGYCSKSDQPREVAEKEAQEFLRVIEDSASYQFGYNHSIAYCLVGYMCGYFRHYYPLQYLTAYLNNAANDDDIIKGTACAEKLGIKVTMPKWGISKSEYYFDEHRRIISKGLSSLKYMGTKLANEIYELSQNNSYERFIDLLQDLTSKTSIDIRQLTILIKIDFFSDFGNQRELLRIMDLYQTVFKNGEVKQIKKETVAGTPLEPAIKKYSIGTTKSGAESKKYVITDMESLLKEINDIVMSSGMADLDDHTKIKNVQEIMGYLAYTSGEEKDRRKLFVTDIKELKRKKDNAQFGYSVFTKSIGSGKEARFTIFNRVYNNNPFNANDIIYCRKYSKEGKYYTLLDYEVMI